MDTNNAMFCYQCQETMGGTGCTRVGMCGKKPDLAAMQDLLIYVTKGLSAITTQLRREKTEITADVNHMVTANLLPQSRMRILIRKTSSPGSKRHSGRKMNCWQR